MIKRHVIGQGSVQIQIAAFYQVKDQASDKRFGQRCQAKAGIPAEGGRRWFCRMAKGFVKGKRPAVVRSYGKPCDAVRFQQLGGDRF